MRGVGDVPRGAGYTTGGEVILICVGKEIGKDLAVMVTVGVRTVVLG